MRLELEGRQAFRQNDSPPYTCTHTHTHARARSSTFILELASRALAVRVGTRIFAFLLFSGSASAKLRKKKSVLGRGTKSNAEPIKHSAGSFRGLHAFRNGGGCGHAIEEAFRYLLCEQKPNARACVVCAVCEGYLCQSGAFVYGGNVCAFM